MSVWLEASYFWISAIANLALVLFVVVAIEEFMNGGSESKIPALSAPAAVDLGRFLPAASGILSHAFGRGGIARRFHGCSRKAARLRVFSRIRASVEARCDWLSGPGFLGLPRATRNPSAARALTAFLWLLFVFGMFRRLRLQSETAHRRSSNGASSRRSSLSMALTAVLFLISFAVLTWRFYADRFRLPLSFLFLMLIAFSTSFSGVDHLFWSEPIQPVVLDQR